VLYCYVVLLQTANFSVTDCRSLVKTLVCGTKTITWAVVSCKSPNTDQTMITSKQFHPKVCVQTVYNLIYSVVSNCKS